MCVCVTDGTLAPGKVWNVKFVRIKQMAKYKHEQYDFMPIVDYS